MKIGDKVYVKDGYLTADWQIPQAEIVAIAYEENSNVPMVYLLSWIDTFQTHWVHRIGIKKE